MIAEFLDNERILRPYSLFDIFEGLFLVFVEVNATSISSVVEFVVAKVLGVGEEEEGLV